jgi:hypothetical protein
VNAAAKPRWITGIKDQMKIVLLLVLLLSLSRPLPKILFRRKSFVWRTLNGALLA